MFWKLGGTESLTFKNTTKLRVDNQRLMIVDTWWKIQYDTIFALFHSGEEGEKVMDTFLYW